MEQEQDIHEIVAKAVVNEADAFRALYEHLADKVFNYVRYRVSSGEDALDITQEVFIDLYKALPNFTYESTPQFYSFVFVITKRKLAKVYTRKEKSIDEQTVELDESMVSASNSDVAQEDEVKRALSELEPDTREIVVLHHWSRYTFKEIASLIEMTESAVRVRHHRALKTLSALIDIPS